MASNDHKYNPERHKAGEKFNFSNPRQTLNEISPEQREKKRLKLKNMLDDSREKLEEQPNE
jgi:hypothetical protein